MYQSNTNVYKLLLNILSLSFLLSQGKIASFGLMGGRESPTTDMLPYQVT